MKIIIRSIWILTLVIGLISLYWVLSRYTDLFVDELLEKGKWGNVSPVTTFVLSVISILILTITLRFYNLISSTIDLSKSLKMAFFLSIFFILIATMFWSVPLGRDIVDFSHFNFHFIPITDWVFISLFLISM